MDIDKYEKEKNNNFKDIVNNFAPGDPELQDFTQAGWLTSRANKFGENKEFELALKDYQEAIHLCYYPPAFLGIAVVYRLQKKPKVALDILLHIPKEEELPKYFNYLILKPQINFNIAYLYYELGFYTKALEYCDLTLDNLNNKEYKKITEFVTKNMSNELIPDREAQRKMDNELKDTTLEMKKAINKSIKWNKEKRD